MLPSPLSESLRGIVDSVHSVLKLACFYACPTHALYFSPTTVARQSACSDKDKDHTPRPSRRITRSASLTAALHGISNSSRHRLRLLHRTGIARLAIVIPLRQLSALRAIRFLERSRNTVLLRMPRRPAIFPEITIPPVITIEPAVVAAVAITAQVLGTVGQARVGATADLMLGVAGASRVSRTHARLPVRPLPVAPQ